MSRMAKRLFIARTFAAMALACVAVLVMPAVAFATEYTISPISIGGADTLPTGAAVDPTTKHLVVGSDGVTFTFTLTDSSGAPVTSESCPLSVDPGLADGTLAIGCSEKDGVYKFTLSSVTLPAGSVVDLSEANFVVPVGSSVICGTSPVTSVESALSSELQQAIAGVDIADVVQIKNQANIQASFYREVDGARTALSGSQEGTGPKTYYSNSDVVVEANLTDDLFGLFRESGAGALETNVSCSGLQDTSLPASGYTQATGSSAWSQDALTLSEEGSYSVGLTYSRQGDRAPYGFSSYGGVSSEYQQDSDVILIDKTAPSVTEATMAEASGDQKVGSGSNATLVGEQREIDVWFYDENGIAADSITLAAVRRDQSGEDIGTEDVVPATFDPQSGEAVFTLVDDGLYRLSDLTVSVRDKAGNPMEGIAVKPFLDASSTEDDPYAAACVISGLDTGSDKGPRIDLCNPDGTAVSGATAVVKGSKANFWTKDAWWPFYSSVFAGSRLGPAIEDEIADQDGKRASVIPTDGFELDLETGKYDQVCSLDEEGLHELTFSYRGISSSKSVVVDGTAPSLKSVSLRSAPAADEVAEYPDGSTTLIGRSGDIVLDVQDLIDDKNYPALVSGVARVTLSVRRRDVPSAQLEEMSLEASRDQSGEWVAALSDPGSYDLSSAEVVATDAVGNVSSSMPLSGVGGVSLSGGQRVSVVDVVDERVRPVARVEVDDAPEAPIATSSFYHRGEACLHVEVTDPWVGVYQHVKDVDNAMEKGFLSGSVTQADGSVDQGISSSWVFSSLSPDSTGSVWSCDYALPSKEGLPLEGTYDVALSYAWAGGSPIAGEGDTSFCCDHTGPAIGPLIATTVSPSMWGIVFSPTDENFSLSAVDRVSEVSPETAACSLVGPTATQAQASWTNDVLSFSLVGNNQRMFLSGSMVSIADKAGNPSSTGSLDTWCEASGTNLPWALGTSGKTHEVVVDTQGPTLSLSYDNVDVRNGHYYNAARTATLRVTEDTFDLIKANDPNRVVLTASVDGRQRQLDARDFENPSGDGRTWAASLACDSDGDWVLDANLTDPAGHAAEPVHDAFTVDTIAPLLTVSFDNHDAANGMYYKAPRTATVGCVERNFSAGIAPVTTTAKDASGSAVDAPGVGVWQGTGEQYGWSCQVYFGGELHYALSASCVDLAGNSAQTVEVPEFVVDMTAPQASVERVDDRAAYAGEVAPLASASDANYDPSHATFSLSGAHRGPVSWTSGTNVSVTATGETDDYVDFAHELGNDDVYTLSVEETDLAGNSASASKTFSVNRFGSNYVWGDDVASIRGSYLGRPRDVTVTEVNVSGLDTSRSHCELALDSQVRTLDEGLDYQVAASDDSGWSATTYVLPASLFSSDGYYRVMLTSMDLAGNLSQNLMEDKDANRSGVASVAFAVDETTPVPAIENASSDQVYFGPSREVSLDAKDGVALDRATLEVDGSQVATWDSSQLEDQASWEIPGDAALHTLTLTAIDKAGNTRSKTVGNVAVARDWWAFLAANPKVLAWLAAAAILVAGALAMGIALGVRHHRLTEARRNPFGH